MPQQKRNFLHWMFFQKPEYDPLVQAQDLTDDIVRPNDDTVQPFGHEQTTKKWAKLDVRVGKTRNLVTLSEFPAVIGKKSNGLTLDDKDVSPVHAVMDFYMNELIITDVNSKNGVRIGEFWLDPGEATAAFRGDVIRIGRSEITVIDFGVAKPLANQTDVPDTQEDNNSKDVNNEPIHNTHDTEATSMTNRPYPTSIDITAEMIFRDLELIKTPGIGDVASVANHNNTPSIDDVTNHNNTPGIGDVARHNNMITSLEHDTAPFFTTMGESHPSLDVWQATSGYQNTGREYAPLEAPSEESKVSVQPVAISTVARLLDTPDAQLLMDALGVPYLMYPETNAEDTADELPALSDIHNPAQNLDTDASDTLLIDTAQLQQPIQPKPIVLPIHIETPFVPAAELAQMHQKKADQSSEMYSLAMPPLPIRDTINCINCDTKNTSSDKFCNKCGIPTTKARSLETKTVLPPITPPAAKLFCDKCGTKIVGQIKFCGDCGNKL